MKLADVLLRGLRSAQPLASAVPEGTLYYVTDEAITEQSIASAWVTFTDVSAASAITQLTGDVTAGPGSGSQVATIGNDKIITAKIINAAVTYAKIQDVSAISKLLGRGSAAGAGDVEELTLGTNLSMAGTTLNATSPARTGVINFVIDGGGSVITTGFKGVVEVPFAGTITGVSLFSMDPAIISGSIVVDIWKDTYANYPPIVADTITASAKPTISAATKSKDTTLTGWTTAIAAGDVLGFNVDSVSSLTRVLISLTVQVP